MLGDVDTLDAGEPGGGECEQLPSIGRRMQMDDVDVPLAQAAMQVPRLSDQPPDPPASIRRERFHMVRIFGQ
jgi:hypothetical protein